MDIRPKIIDYYDAPNGKIPFKEWFYGLRDGKAQQIVDRRLANVRLGSFGDCEGVGQGVSELKIHYGPGYRVYFGQVKNTIMLLLCGGTKKTQNADIHTAHQYWAEYRNRL